jgi:hypothetical protein
MRSDEVPIIQNMLSQIIQSDARSYAVLWALNRLCYRLRKEDVLTESEIEKMFDPAEAQKSLPEAYQETMRKTIQGLQDYCLGRTETVSNFRQ